MLKHSQHKFTIAAARRIGHRTAAGRHRRMMLFAALATGLILSTNSLAEDVYKWVDENGVTHFSSRPPETERSYEEIRVRNRRGYRPSSSTASRSTAQSGSTSNAAEDDDEQGLTEPGNEITVKNPDKVAANCERARNNIATIESRRRVLLSDGSGGQRRLSDEERQALMQESQDYLDRWCQDQ